MRAINCIVIFLGLIATVSLTSCGQSNDERPQASPTKSFGVELSEAEVDAALQQVNCTSSLLDFSDRGQLRRLEKLPLQGAAVCGFDSDPNNPLLLKYTGDLESLAVALTAPDTEPNSGCMEINVPLPAVWVLDAKGSLFQAYVPNDGCAEHMNAWSEENIPSDSLKPLQK